MAQALPFAAWLGSGASITINVSMKVRFKQ
jgi:hypothetical protein